MTRIVFLLSILLVWACPSLHAQSVNQPGSDPAEEQESVENELSSSEEVVSMPAIYTATAGTFESAGRVILSSDEFVMREGTSNDLGQQALLHASPVSFAMYQNYPNPFNPSTTIQFDLPDPAFVTVKVYNMLGQEVRTLLDHESMEDGEQEVDFDASLLASGVYFYRIVAEGNPNEEDGVPAQKYTEVKKMLLVK
ncbi:MAG: T9SS type A sorting domain-containing protein [Ignavibacteriae bacterium]|nr:T9SS type A sorting domain-containing protein [Ignavibacteria bacterium]MBI3363876.1 T9SS type A sorting domain-containing protein [Ignavibacteriota bacterium]